VGWCLLLLEVNLTLTDYTQSETFYEFH